MTVGPLAGVLEHAVMGPSPVRMMGRGTTSRTGYWTDLNLSLEVSGNNEDILFTYTGLSRPQGIL